MLPTAVALFTTTLTTMLATSVSTAQGPSRLLGWNDLGMHCTDNDTSVFSILPPYNTFHAQLMVGGHVVTGNYTVTYEAVADATGSINKSSIGKIDFWQHALALFGANLQPDEGLAGFRMPGAANTPQGMPFNTPSSEFIATGVPVTPYDDNLQMRPYPLMRLVARNASGQQIAATNIVTPVSAEMACNSCHGSGNNPAARPTNGWVYGPPATDDRLNILKLHDDRFLGDPVYTAALQAVGYSSSGLYHTAVVDSTPVLCARCHASNALGAAGQPGVASMTSAMHTRHGLAQLPDGRLLNDVPDRASCYTCHPGAATRCLRGAMGKAIGADGKSMMSCSDCHGNMAEVGNPARTGWLDEPNCQNCHSGDAVANSGAIRFTNGYDTPGHRRVPANTLFATTPDMPQQGFSLYRFSEGHGGLQCSACHGSPHAVWPSTEANDNQQSINTQGHVGMIVECSSCHSNLSNSQWQGPHGMHPTGSSWVDHHGDVAESVGTSTCRACHGTDDRGTVLSRSQADRTLNTQFGTKTFWRGYQVGCYDCHNGANSDSASNNTPPVVANRNESTPTDTPLALTLTATDANANPLTLRIVEQPTHGTVAFDGSNAIYRTRDGYIGTDSFTYAAADGKSNSNLGTVTIAVQARACAGSVETYGYGCEAGNGQVPTIAVDGCPSPGQQIDIVSTNQPTTSWAVYALGFGRGTTELNPDGCTFRISSLLATSQLVPVLNGNSDLPVLIPAGLGALDATMQSFCLDASSPRGYVASPGIELHVR